jgi:hypothetical protein
MVGAYSTVSFGIKAQAARQKFLAETPQRLAALGGGLYAKKFLQVTPLACKP